MSSDLQNCNMTPYYRALLKSLGPEHPLRRTVESLDDCTPVPGELADPLGEEAHSPCPGLIHTYPDKVLLFATLDCAVYCQYCTRGRLVGSKGWNIPDETFQWLEKVTDVRDVLISGGDPLMLTDGELAGLFSKIRKIKFLKILG